MELKTIERLASGLLWALAKLDEDHQIVIERRVWGEIIDPPSLVFRKCSGNACIEVSKLGSPYGYLRISIGSCRLEGVLRYRQFRTLFIPQRIERCESIKPMKAEGIVVEEKE